jgi:hypothetical protein
MGQVTGFEPANTETTTRGLNRLATPAISGRIARYVRRTIIALAAYAAKQAGVGDVTVYCTFPVRAAGMCRTVQM